MRGELASNPKHIPHAVREVGRAPFAKKGYQIELMPHDAPHVKCESADTIHQAYANAEKHITDNFQGRHL